MINPVMCYQGVMIYDYPVVQVVPGGVLFLRDWHLEVGHRTVRVPAGYRSNFATIPWFARWLISPVDRVVIMAALAHDWLVREFGGPRPDMTWAEAATVMRKIMRAYAGDSTTKTIKRHLIYWAVSAYGLLK